jgi:hypothetical protein
MMDTLYMEEGNKRLLLQAAAKHTMDVCVRGTEMLFTWRKHGTLEIRVDGLLVSV